MLFNRKNNDDQKKSLEEELVSYIKFCHRYFYDENNYKSLKAYFKLRNQIKL